MAMIPQKPRKKRMVDIVHPVPIRQAVRKIEAEKKAELKEVEENLKRIDKQVEEFEKKEEEKFKEEEEKKRTKKKSPRRHSPKTYILIGLSLILLGVIIYLVVEILPRAKIKITTQKTDWTYIESITASKNTTQFDVSQKQIPAEVFSQTKNFNFSFPATGKKQVERKANGKIIIYNAYSSDPQLLVVNTRLATPDGKIFRLDKRVTVPGAKIIEGKIVASNIEATVVADKPGPQYNIEPVSRFSIPGFQGSEKYQKFYAESTEPMKGGFIGEAAFPTDEDIKKAKEKASKDLKDYIESSLLLQIPPEFKIIDSSKQFIVLKEQINKDVDEKGNFTIFMEAESLIIAFREPDLSNLIEEVAKANLGADFRIKNYKLDYGVGRPDFKQGKISFAVNFQGIFEQPVDIENFRQKSLKKTESDLKVLVSTLPNIEKLTISLWPFWVKKIPDDLNRVKIEVE